MCVYLLFVIFYFQYMFFKVELLIYRMGIITSGSSSWDERIGQPHHVNIDHVQYSFVKVCALCRDCEFFIFLF